MQIQTYVNICQAPHIDRTDFLNPVVREKKRFEDILDDSVAAGLNAATDALMNQVSLRYDMRSPLTDVPYVRSSTSSRNSRNPENTTLPKTVRSS